MRHPTYRIRHTRNPICKPTYLRPTPHSRTHPCIPRACPHAPCLPPCMHCKRIRNLQSAGWGEAHGMVPGRHRACMVPGGQTRTANQSANCASVKSRATSQLTLSNAFTTTSWPFNLSSEISFRFANTKTTFLYTTWHQVLHTSCQEPDHVSCDNSSSLLMVPDASRS